LSVPRRVRSNGNAGNIFKDHLTKSRASNREDSNPKLSTKKNRAKKAVARQSE